MLDILSRMCVCMRARVCVREKERERDVASVRLARPCIYDFTQRVYDNRKIPAKRLHVASAVCFDLAACNANVKIVAQRTSATSSRKIMPRIRERQGRRQKAEGTRCARRGRPRLFRPLPISALLCTELFRSQKRARSRANDATRGASIVISDDAMSYSDDVMAR